MTANGVFQFVFFFGVLLLLVKPLGSYMTRVYDGKRLWLSRLLGPIERITYRLAGIRSDEEMDWKQYAGTLLAFNLVGMLLLYGLQRLQGWLPFNPQGFGAVAPDLAFNTAASFTTNTNWQAYTPETTMSYLTQMAGLAVQNFVSAATGMAAAVAVIRGFSRKSVQTIGNFWVDLVRGTLYVLLPISIVFALVLVSQGIVQNFSPYAKVPVLQQITYDEPVTGPDGQPVLDAKGQPQTKKSTLTEQVLPMGPAASQIIIKQLGTNGGGFFNANSAHPFENPTPLIQFPGDAVDPRHPVRSRLHLRLGGEGHPARLGVGDGHADHLGRHGPRWDCGGTAGEPDAHPAGGRSASVRPAIRRQHGGEGDPIWHPEYCPVGGRHDRHLLRGGQRDA